MSEITIEMLLMVETLRNLRFYAFIVCLISFLLLYKDKHKCNLRNIEIDSEIDIISLKIALGTTA
jgi:hypothetical protein